MPNIKITDLSTDLDVRGDKAYFIEEHHFSDDEWSVDDEAAIPGPTFFRVIFNGQQQHGHGWIEGNKVIQWG